MERLSACHLIDEMPPPLTIPDDARDLTVVLALPSLRPGIRRLTTTPVSKISPDFAALNTKSDSNGLDSSALMSVGSLRGASGL